MNKHLLTLTAGLALCAGQVFAQESVEKTFDCVADTWIRSNNPTWNSGATQTSLEVHKVAGDAAFYGLMAFDFSVPDGMRVESATLRMVTAVCRGPLMGVRAYDNDFKENTKYVDESDYVDAALKNAAVATFTAAGNGGKAIYDNGLSEKNQNFDAWVNNIDVTGYVKTLSTSVTRVNFLLSQDDGDNTAKIAFYSKDNTGEAAAQYDALKDLTHDQLKPVLIVKYVEDANTLNATLDPVADTFVRSTNTSKYGSSSDMEIYWKEGAETGTRDTQFYGLMSFNLPADVLDGTYEVTSARLRLVNTQCKGDRAMDIYKYPAEFDEANADWATEKDNVATAFESDPIASFSAKGQNTKRMDDSGISDEYKDVAAWTSYIDLTDYIKANPSNLNILITRSKANTTNNDAMKIATKEANDYVNTKTDAANPFTFKAEDLKPQLYLTYSKKDSGETTAIEIVEMEDVDAPVEYYTLQGIRVENPAHGLYIMKKGNKVVKIVL